MNKRVSYKTLAYTDELTSLANYRAFKNTFNLELYRAKRHKYPLCLVLLDINNFKGYNDKYGHITGDKLLHNFACLLKKSLRKYDLLFQHNFKKYFIKSVKKSSPKNCKKSTTRSIIRKDKVLLGRTLFRYAGDEFTLLLPHIETNYAEELMKRINFIINKNLKITFSWGISEYPIIRSKKDLLEEADKRMYKMKGLKK